MAVGEPRISLDELRLAARNHALPLEALRYPITPTGLHYLLIHYDIPLVDEETYRLEIGGLVSSPLSLSLDDLRGLPAIEVASTMECAGNGRALIEPAVVSQPWVQEAVGTASWRGAALADVLGLAGMTRGRDGRRLHRLGPRLRRASPSRTTSAACPSTRRAGPRSCSPTR